MSAINMTFEVTDLFSTYGDNEEYLIQIKIDDKIYEDKYNAFKPVNVSYDSFKKDLKIPIKLFKGSVNLGNGELNLYQTSFLSKEKVISKWVGLTPVLENLPKKSGTNITTALASMARVQVKVSINYGQKTETSKPTERTSSTGKNTSRTPDQNKNSNMTNKVKPKIENNIQTEKYRSNNDDTNDLLRVIRGKQPVKGQAKGGNNNSQNASLLNSEKKESNAPVETPKEEPREEVVERPLDLSVIDDIFSDERADFFDSPLSMINSVIEKIQSAYNEQYFQNLPDDQELLRKEANAMIQELFNMQDTYYRSFNDSLSLNQKLREFLVKYGAKYRVINKKNNKLKERIESNNLKSNLTTIVNREENDRIKDIINLNKQELNSFRDIFRVNYTETDLKKFKEDSAQRNEERDKEALLKIAEKLFLNPANLEKLPQEKRAQLENLLLKYDIRLIQPRERKPPEVLNCASEEAKAETNMPESGTGPSYDTNEGYNYQYNTQPQESNNKIEFSDDEEEQHDNNINTDNPKANEDGQTNFVQNKVNDQTDQKLNTFLNDFYAKKRLSQIPFRRVSQGNYEFGTQKVLVKVENEKIKVRVGGGYLLLDKFIEMNAPVEEAKIMKAQNISGKFSKNVNVKKVTGGKAIYSLESSSQRNNKTPDKIVTTAI